MDVGAGERARGGGGEAGRGGEGVGSIAVGWAGRMYEVRERYVSSQTNQYEASNCSREGSER